MMGASEPLPVKVVAFSGSARQGSYTRRALDLSAVALRESGAELTIVDLGEWRLPPFDGSSEKEHPEAQKLKTLVRGCDALLFATPVYHDSFSGILKNALDLMYADELSEKVAALVAVGGGRVGQSIALDHLRAVLREMGAWALPRQVLIGNAAEAFDAQGQLVDAELSQRLALLAQELVVRAKQLRRRR